MASLIHSLFRSHSAAPFVHSAILLFLIAVMAHAQGVGSSRGLTTGDGSNSIQGRVFFPSGEQNGGKMIKLHLESTQATNMSTVTDQDGVFRFNGLPPGNYSVVVDGGKDYESTREPVTIDPIGRGRIVQVTIQLRPKADASNPAFAGVPQTALDFYQKGMAAAQKGNAKSAVEFLGKAVTAYPNFSMALSDLGVQYIKLLQWDKAAETFEALLKQKPDDATGQLDLGIALYNVSGALLNDKKLDESNQKLGQAESHLREALKLKSTGPSAHYYLGMTLIKLRRYDEAQSELESAIKNGGDGIALAHKFLGGLYFGARRNKEAADELEKYLQLDPKAPDAERIKGTIKDLRSKQ
ncbi:MAG TPA: tetratricopeptide repeat protein [Blastocatellia bacterium]|nr:tetratricopeptide repeat protein [Blastocatellia bacterium]